MKEIVDRLSAPALLEQAAEECSELNHVCLKLARKLRGESPTPATKEKLLSSLNEEVADVFVTIEALVDLGFISFEKIDEIAYSKKQRWKLRLKESEYIKNY